MNKFRPTLFFVILIFCFAYLPLGYSAPVSPAEITSIIEDGWTRSDTVPRNNATDYLIIDRVTAGGVSFIPWIEWNISSIPDTATIYAVRLRYRAYNSWTTAYNISWREWDALSAGPSDSTPTEIVANVTSGERYANETGAHTAGEIYTVQLGNNVVSNFTDALARDWFAIGARQQGNDDQRQIYSSEGGYSPRLLVDTDQGNYTVTLDGTFYENGTRGPDATVTIYEYDGSTTDHVVNQTRYFGFDTEPISITWGLSGGGTRRYHIPLTSENVTIYIPEDTYATYEAQVKDYIGRTGLGDTYLEAYRTINGTEDLVERMILHSTENTVPITLVVGELYHLQILWGDLTRYDWGYYIAGTDPAPLLYVKDITFSERVQLAYQYLRVEATRPTNTTITVNYEDTLGETSWVNITISERGGVSPVHTDTDTLSTKTFNWAGANASLDYVVYIEFRHDTFGDMEEYQFLDADPVNVQAPSLDLLGSMGNVQTGNLIAFFIAVIFYAGFSYEWGSTAGAIVGASIVSALTYWGWANYSYNFLAFVWFATIIVAIRGRG